MQRLGRSRLLRGLSLLPGLLALLAAYSCAQSSVSGPCADGLTLCGLECVDLRTSPQHCGSCDSACATGTACEGGSCAGGCVEGLLECGHGCVDPQTDPQHCGACGYACQEGALCAAGSCGVACPDPYTDCDGVCVDLQSSVQHCGACNARCAVGTFCVGGTCQFCQEGFARCGARCVDTRVDPQHCGACDARCPERFVCVDSRCEDDCAPGLSLCGDVCVNAQTSNEHCGSCDTACEAGFQCSGGVCQNRCAEAQLFCAGQCVDAQSNALHCGACFQSCPLSYTCVDGACRNPCADGMEPCDGTCVDLMNDAANCSACYNACAPGLTCGAGVCGCAGETVCGLCEPRLLEPSVPQTVTGDNTGGLDSYHPSCGGGGGNEIPYSFTAPTNGSYSFSLAGSTYDTLLAVVSSSCAELGCNDDSGGPTSLVSTTLRSGQTVYMVVDGFAGATGAFTLTVTGGLSCTTTDLGSTVPQTVSGTTAAAPDVLTASCGALGGRDVKYAFTAPADGEYTFDTVGSSFNTVLHVHGGSCAGPELGCNDDSGGPQSAVTVPLTAGQVVVVAVDGAGAASSGAFTLNIH
jgi:hypothetical protein